MQIYKNFSLQDLPGEIWRPVKISGFEDKYLCSNMGRIKSLPKIVQLFNGGEYVTKERIIKQRLSGGYLFTAMFNGKNERRLDIQSHIVICLTWIDNPESKPEVNHTKGVKTDNRVSELEWVTRKENVVHAYNNGFYKESDRTIQCLCTGRMLHIDDASNELNVSKNYIHAMLNGSKSNWSHFIRI